MGNLKTVFPLPAFLQRHYLITTTLSSHSRIGSPWAEGYEDSGESNNEVTMLNLLPVAFVAFTVLVSLFPLSASAADSMYRCDDGTFTNVAERMCVPYEPKGTVLVLPEGASLASMRALLGEPVAKTAQLPDPTSVCQLYQEWQSLNLRSGGGVTFANTQDVPRWISLSRIFTAIGTPHCP